MTRLMETSISGTTISTILKHDRKQNSYKIALLRAINDVVLSFPEMQNYRQDVAIPLDMLAAYWIAYYWAFAEPNVPIMQGTRAVRNDALSQDMAFRNDLTELRWLWEQEIGSHSPADGFFLVNELRIPRKRQTYSRELRNAYERTIRSIAGKALRQPIQYAGPNNWEVFDKPQKFGNLKNAVAVPSTLNSDTCLVIKSDLWNQFRELSLWVEALCIHEWSLFTETVKGGADRGTIYHLLTERPDNRRPLTWERNQVDILLMEGLVFTCPWTEKPILQGEHYDLDHLIPISIYPVNELWNLVPADPEFNSHVKGNRLPSTDRLARAYPHFLQTYQHYLQSADLSIALHEDVNIRFVLSNQYDFPEAVAIATSNFISQISYSRNIAQF